MVEIEVGKASEIVEKMAEMDSKTTARILEEAASINLTRTAEILEKNPDNDNSQANIGNSQPSTGIVSV
jgi:hypothetical protein